jgi:hypothetical protein
MSSSIFLTLLFFVRPDVKISKNIAFDGTRYIIKIVNLSTYRLYDVKVELIHKSTYQAPGGTNTKNTPIKLTNYERLSIPGKPKLPWNKDYHAGYAILYSTKEDLKNMFCEDGHFIEFTFKAKHGLSSFSKIKTEPYTHKSSIKKGEFKFGNSTEIVDE